MVWLALSVQWPEQEHGMSGVATGGCDDHKSMKERRQNEMSAHPTLLLNQQRPEHFIIIIKTHYSQKDFWKEYIYQQMIAAVRSLVFILHTGTVPFDSVTSNKCKYTVCKQDIQACPSHWFGTDLFSAQEEVESLSLDGFPLLLFFQSDPFSLFSLELCKFL